MSQTEVVNICGVLVHARAERLAEVAARLGAMPGVEVHSESPDGRLIVTLEGDLQGRIASSVDDFHTVEGVLSASMIYHHYETIESDADAAAAQSH